MFMLTSGTSQRPFFPVPVPSVRAIVSFSLTTHYIQDASFVLPFSIGLEVRSESATSRIVMEHL